MTDHVSGMKSIVFALVLSFIVVGAQGQEKPNIIVFLVDDMGWQDTSVPFWTERTPLNEMYATPNMERLANAGMKFTQAYASSVCSPTRVSLMSGMNAARHRVTNWTLQRNQSVDAADTVLNYPKWNVNGLQPGSDIEFSVQATTLPMLLQGAGYHTIHVGKAHFGAMGTPGENPLNIGFDVNIAGHAAGGPGSYLGTENFGNNADGSYKAPWGVPGLSAFHGKDIFLTEALTQKAIGCMDDAIKLDKPFFLYMAHYAVHVPFYGDDRFIQPYLDRGLTKKEAQYASMVEGMDKSLGDIMDFLDRNKIAENTTIFFLSDNGGFAIDDRGRKDAIHQWNAPLKSGKGSAYEGGIRIPMIVKWPNNIHGNSHSTLPVLIEDVFPTVLDIAGITDRKTIQPIDGRSFKDVLLGNKRADRKMPLVWHFPNNWGPTGPGIGATSTIREGDWKLIYWHKDGKKELYNVVKDIGENNDLAQSETGRVDKLSKKLGRYLKAVKAQMPTFKENGNPSLYPDEI